MSARIITTVQGFVLLVLAAASLAGCAGTALRYTGQICGDPASLELADRKDRSGFEAAVDCGDGKGLKLSTADSSVSSVLAAQAALLQTLSSLVAQLAVPPPVAWTPPLPPSQREALSARIDHALQMDNSMTWNPEWIRR